MSSNSQAKVVDRYMPKPPDPSIHDPESLVTAWRANVDIKDRKYRMRTFESCFVGSEACTWLVDSGIASDVHQAISIGNALMEAGYFHHVVREHDFKNEELYYRFASDEKHGEVRRRADGALVSWLDVLDPDFGGVQTDRGNRQANLDHDEAERDDMVRTPDLGVHPVDEYNAELLNNVHPRAWISPAPTERYNMVVIGGGTAGLVTAAATAGLGGRVALIESHLLGGDCLNMGCVPSKALLRAAKVAHLVRRSGDYGIRLRNVDGDDNSGAVDIDFPAVMSRLRRLRAQISHHDSAERFAKLGVDVFLGRARFTAKDTVVVGDQTLTFARAAIATGASPVAPPIPGLAEVPYLTNTTLFNLTQCPPRMGIIGGGVIGVEMAQAFQRLGSQVTLFERGEQILSREDPEAAECVKQALIADGVTFRLGTTITRIAHRPIAGSHWPAITVDTGAGCVNVDAVLVATGRRPNVENLGLESAGVDYDTRQGVIVNDKLQSSNSRIYGVGDVCTRYQFTHAADFMARIVVRNALFYGRDRFSDLLIPWCTYTEPELAHVGLYERDLVERDIAYTTFTRPFGEVDRAIIDGETHGFVRIHVKHGSDEILGATVVGAHAGDLISELTLAMRSKTGLGALASVVHPYPTSAESIRQVGDLYNRTRLTGTVRSLFRGLLSLRR